MISKLSVIISLTLLASANPLPAPIPQTGNQCTTGTIQCCDTIENIGNPTVSGTLGALAATVAGIDSVIGFNCNPISVIGLDSSNCPQQPVCCTGNSFNGLIVLGCSPLNLGL